MAHNLPIQMTSFVGREKELGDIAQLLSNPDCRLLTLVGLGGTGKTRLAIATAVGQVPHFAHGVYFVPLTAVNSPDLLVSAVAGVLKIPFFDTSQNPRTQLIHYFGEKQILLVMDNFEQLLDSGGFLIDILQAGSGVKFLVASRERLNLQEEWVFAVEGLAFPTNQSDGQLESYGAIELFIQRARQLQPYFSLDKNAEAVRVICQQVEGMPLGLELAASWLRVMSCQQIATHMPNALGFLTTSLRNIPERHHSLRAAFEQSWNLLAPSEKEVLMRVSVFRGGVDLEAAEQVSGASLAILIGLVDKSLVRLNSNGRYDLHELVRQYSVEKLLELRETKKTNQRHAEYFLKLAEAAEAHAFGREQIAWFDRLTVEFDNLRAALTWSEGTEMGLRLAGALGWFFSERGYWNEGLSWIERMLATRPDGSPNLRAKALHSAGALAGLMGNRQQASDLCEQALALARGAEDRWNMAWALSHLGIYVGNEKSAAWLDECLAIFREINDPMGISHSLGRRSLLLIENGDFVDARSLAEEAMINAVAVGDKAIIAWANWCLGNVCWQHNNDIKQARNHFEISLSLFREAHFPFWLPLILVAEFEHTVGNITGAQKGYMELLNYLKYTSPSHHHVYLSLVGLAAVARERGQFARTVRLLGAASNIGPDHNSVQEVTPLRDQLGETDFAGAWAAGKAMTRDQAIDYALDDSDTASEAALSASAAANLLKRREIEILRLLAKGLSNREIAAQLILAPSTVKWYLSEIYGKLGVVNRTQAEIRAREMALLD